MYSLLAQAMKAPAVQASLKAQGVTEFVLPLGAFKKFEENERNHWGTIIKSAGIQPE